MKPSTVRNRLSLLAKALCLTVAVCGSLFVSKTALAQDPYGPGIAPGGLGGEPPQSQKKKKSEPVRAPDGSELHAASGGSDAVVAPGGEPSLPEEPLKLKRSLFNRMGSDFDFDTLELGRAPRTTRHYYGPYYEEFSGKYSFKLAFPVWAERRQPSSTNASVEDRASLYGGLFYNRRSAERSDDIFFPLYWNLVDKLDKSRTTVVGPFVNRVAEGEHDNWLAPLYFTGKRKNGGYTLIPPLLTYTNTDGRGGFNLIGPMFCSWEGGRYCDARTAQNIDLGIVPFYFFGQNAEKKYEVIPPLLHYYSYNDRDLSWTNIWGPYYRGHTQERELFHMLPLYWSIWGKNERHTTVLPFFHYGWHDKSWLFVNPLYLLGHGQDGESTFVTWGYARYRGRTSLDMITPLYWHYQDPDIHLDEKLLFPFLFSRTSARESTQVFFPFWAHSERYGVSQTTFISPFFSHSTDLRGWSTNIYPFFYIGRDATSTHTVVAPFFWDFATPTSRATVVFPAFWRFSNDKEVSQLVGNLYYHEKRLSSGLDWEFHLFPVFSYGETPDGHWWNILYGLAGYTHRGNLTKMRTLWIPITLSGKDED